MLVLRVTLGLGLMRRKQFLSLTGATYERTEHSTLLEIVTGAVKQLQGQTVTQYRLAFQAKLRSSTALGDPVLVADFFVQGLLTHLDQICLTYHAGKLSESLDKVYEHVLNEELSCCSTHAMLLSPYFWHGCCFPGQAKEAETLPQRGGGAARVLAGWPWLPRRGSC
jgi:hypothetical protein